MSAHTECCSQSAVFCDALYRALQTRIPNLRRSQSKRWRGIYCEGRTRFAYVSHFKNDPRVEVWCRGDAARFSAEAGLAYRERAGRAAVGRSEEFPGRFSVSGTGKIERAADALHRLAYPSS